MNNRLIGNLTGISVGGGYQGNLNGIGINDASALLDEQEIQVAKNRANGVYQARQSSNVDHLTGIITNRRLARRGLIWKNFSHTRKN